MAKDLVMTFSDVVGDKSNLVLKNVKDEITQEEVTTVMEAVLTSNLFSSKNGRLSKKEYATLVETTKTKYDEF